MPDSGSESMARYRTRGRRWSHPLGDVFSAVDSETGDRVVLTLLYPAGRLTPGHLDAARATANVLGGVVDASINGVIDVVPYADNRVAVITEFLQATALSQQLGNRALPANRVFAILRQVVRALGLAHRAGVAHGALSVGSVLLTGAQGRPDTVVLTDFALQGLMNADLAIPDIAAGQHPVTPERILGLSRSEKEDLYLVGCIGYTMLTGSPPFRTGNSVAVARRHAIEDPMPIAARLRSKGLPPQGLIEVIHRCLAKEAEDRFADMAELEAELCLAQIDAGIHTPWDDLPLPRVDEVRRQAILHGLQAQRGEEKNLGVASEVEIAESRPITIDEADVLAAAVEEKRKQLIANRRPKSPAGVPKEAPRPDTKPLSIPPPRSGSSRPLPPPKFVGIPEPARSEGTKPLHVHRPPPQMGRSFPVSPPEPQRPAPSKADAFDSAVTAISPVVVPKPPAADIEDLVTQPNAKAFPKPAHMQSPGPAVPKPVGPSLTAPVVKRGVVSQTGFVRPPSPSQAPRPPVRYPVAPPIIPTPSAAKPPAPAPPVRTSIPAPPIGASIPAPPVGTPIPAPPVGTSIPAPPIAKRDVPAPPIAKLDIPAPPIDAPAPAPVSDPPAAVPEPGTPGPATDDRPLNLPQSTPWVTTGLGPIDETPDSADDEFAPDEPVVPVRPAPTDAELEALASDDGEADDAPAPHPPEPEPAAPEPPAPQPPEAAVETPAPAPVPVVAREEAPPPVEAPADLPLPAPAHLDAPVPTDDFDDIQVPRKPWGLWLGTAVGLAAVLYGLIKFSEPEDAADEQQVAAAVEPEPAVQPEPAPAREPEPGTDEPGTDEPEQPEPEQPESEASAPEASAPKKPQPAADEPTPKPAADKPKPKPRPKPDSSSASPSSNSGGSASDLASEGNDAFNRGDYRQAASLLEKAVRKVPGNAKYRLLLGDTYFKLGRFSSARSEYVEADELGVASAKRRIEKVDAKLGG